MEYRALGSTGLRVSVLGLGCNRLGWPEHGRTRADMTRLLEHAADAGVTFFDTADVYVAGESERLLGEVFGRGRRDVVIATKVGSTVPLRAGLLARAIPVLRAVSQHGLWQPPSTLHPLQAWSGRNFSPAYLRRAVERSLGRLRRDALDLLQLHSPPLTVMQRDDVFETLDRMKREGAVRWYGVAFGTAPDPASLPAHAGVSTLQIPVAADGATHDLLAWARTRALGVIGNQPLRNVLGAGGRAPTPALARAALRALAQRPDVAVVLTGTTSLAHLRENLAALEGSRRPLGP